MGRDKARKPKKIKYAQRLSLSMLLSGYDPSELWALLVAAGGSPGARHRWVSVGHLVNAYLRMEGRGAKSVGGEHLEGLLTRCLEDEPRLSQLEDFVPFDPRQEVLVRFDENVLRLFPGSVERPVADFDRALLVSEAVDEILIERLGFGVRHLLEVALRYADSAIGVLAPAWSDRDLPGEGPVAVAKAEVSAATSLIEIGTPEEFEQNPELRRALEWATCDAKDLPYDPGHPQSPFGRFLRVRTGGDNGPVQWLPPAFLPEILGFGVTQLAAEAAAASPDTNKKFAQLAVAQVRQALWRFSSTILGPDDSLEGPVVAQGNAVQWVAMLGPGRALLVQVVAKLQLTRPPFSSAPAALLAAQAGADRSCDHRIPIAGGKLILDPDVEVVPLLVVASAGHVAVAQQPGLPGMSLDDLRWAASSADADSDLFTYCRDMSRPDLPQFFGWEAINIWEWWQANGKSLFSGGKAPSFIMISPHQGDSELARAADLARLERALATLKLPPLRAIDGVEDDSSGPPAVFQWRDQNGAKNHSETFGAESARQGHHSRPALVGWAVHLSAVPVALSSARSDWEGVESATLMHNLAGAFAFGLREIDGVWQSCHEQGGISGYVVELHQALTSQPDGRTLWMGGSTVESTARGKLIHAEIKVAPEALAQAADAEITTVHREMAEAINDLVMSAGIHQNAAKQISESWQNAAPTLAVTVMRTPTVRNELPHPIRLDDALVSEVDRLVAQGVEKSGTNAGTYAGEYAKRLDRDVLAPAALEVLTRRLSHHSADDLVTFGMQELERCASHRDRLLRDVGQSSRQLNIEWDPVARYSQLESEYLMLRRCSETAVEATLRSSPSGVSRVDELAWGEILAAARAYLAATMRSESLHHQVSPAALAISNSFEIEVVPDESGEINLDGAGSGRTYDLDIAEFSRARAAFRLSADSSADSGEESRPSETPLASGVDAAMLEGFGASGMDILTTLFALASWPLTEDDPDVIHRTRDEVVDHVVDYTILGQEPDGRVRIESSLFMLTSTTADLAASDWKPWHSRTRKRRLLLQPLAVLSSGMLVVAPHFCLGSLTVYQNYLEQGQLPWSQPQPPAKVDKALERVRDSRNVALERQVAAILRADGWAVIENIKETKPARLNVPSLSTEIDAVAGRSDSPTIWLLEAKDPVETHAVPEIRRALDTFYVDAKGKPSYCTQLRRKYNDLTPHAAAVATALGLPRRPESDPYVIRAMFVTRKPVPAAYVTGPFPFTTTRELQDAIAPL